MNFNPEPTLNYSVANVVTNGWLNIENDQHPLYWVTGKISLSVHVFNNKVQNRLILYLGGQKRNQSKMVSKLKETWTGLNLKEIQSIFNPGRLHSHCHFPKQVVQYLSKQLNNVKDKYHYYVEDEFYTDNYKPGEVALGLSK